MVFPTTIKWVLLVPELSSHVSLEALTKPKEALSRKRRWRYSHPHNYTDFASLNLRIYTRGPSWPFFYILSKKCLDTGRGPPLIICQFYDVENPLECDGFSL